VDGSRRFWSIRTSRGPSAVIGTGVWTASRGEKAHGQMFEGMPLVIG
jgi:hypothetical protein